MDNNEKLKKGILESIIVISIMVIYMVYGIHFLPSLMLLIPLPFIILGVRNHIYNNMFSIIIASLITQLLLGSTTGASLILLFAPLSIAINYCIKSKKNSMETIFISTGAFIISFLLIVALGERVSDFNFTNQLEDFLSQSLNMQIEIFKELGVSNEELLKLSEALEDQNKTIMVRIPSLLVIFSFLVSYINIFLASFGLRKMGYGYVPVQRFSRFKLPNNIIPGIGIMFLAAFIMRSLEVQYHGALLLNITFLVGFIFIIQGLAVLDFLLIRLKIKSVFRFLILALNIFILPTSTILFLIGVIDSVFDLRKLRRQRS